MVGTEQRLYQLQLIYSPLQTGKLKLYKKFSANKTAIWNLLQIDVSKHECFFLPYSHELLSREHSHLEPSSKCQFQSVPFSDYEPFCHYSYNPATDQAVRYETTTNMHKPKHHSGMPAGSGTRPELKYRASQHYQRDS